MHLPTKDVLRSSYNEAGNRVGILRTLSQQPVPWKEPELYCSGCLQLSVGSAAAKQETNRLADSARGVSTGGSVPQMSARKMDMTRNLLKSGSRRLTGVAKDAAKGMEKAGRLKTTATVSDAIHRMRALAEAAKQARCSECKPRRVLCV